MLAVANFVTDFADQAVVLPLALAIAAVLAGIGWWRGAAVWTGAIVATLGLTFLLKLTFIACGYLLAGDVLQSPSGHTAASSAIYGGLLGIMAKLKTGHQRWTLLCATTIAVIIAASRLALGVHTLAEVTVGGLVGICGAVAIVELSGPVPRQLKLSVLGASLILVVALFHGLHLPAEAAIRQIAVDVWPLSACRP